MYSVKTYDHEVNAWAHIFMTHDRAEAFRYARNYSAPLLAKGHNCRTKVVRPSDFSIDAFQLAGNTIH